MLPENISLNLLADPQVIRRYAAILDELADALDPPATVTDVPSPPAPPTVTDVPSPPAPPTVTDVPPPPATSDILDAAGLPWDGRIHAASKALLTKTGTWKLKRGVDPALVAQVEGETRMATGTPYPTGGDIFGPGITFPALMQKVTERMVAGQLTPEQLTTALAEYGLATLPEAMGQPDTLVGLDAKLEVIWQTNTHG